MDDNRIEIVAGLDIPKTKSTIKDELENDIKPDLDSSKALKIVCHIDDESVSTLQTELNRISKGLKLSVPTISVKTDASGIKETATAIDKSIESTNHKVKTLKKSLSDLDKTFTEPFDAKLNANGLINAERTMSVIQDRLSSLGTVTVTGKYNDENAADSLYKIQATITATSGEIRTLNFLLDETDDKFKLLDSSYSDKGVVKVQQDIARLEKELAKFKQTHNSIKSGLVTPLKEATDALIDLKAGVGSVETVEKALDKLNTEAAAIGVNLKSKGASLNIFDNAANKAENFENVIKGLFSDINSLGESGGKSALLSQLENAEKLVAKLNKAEAESGRGEEWSKYYGQINATIQDITNNLKAVEKEEKGIVSLSNEIASKINALNSQSRNRTFFNNSKNPEVSNQIAEINTLKEKYQELYAQLGEAKSPEAVVAVEKELRKLDAEFDNAISSSKDLQYALRDDKALQAKNNKINQLTADMNKYAEANKRAVESTKQMSNGGTFASNWASLIERMKNGAEMTDIELQQLISDFRVFGKEAQAAGLAGAGAFEKFGNAFKLISTYISANQLINMAISRIREATEELKNVNNILTEISKTSERTDESLRKLGANSFDAANKYGRTASDYLLGVQEMSRAGFGEQQSEALAELSILAQAAGDMSAEMANQYIIATNAAYGLKGSTEELNRVLDAQNYITNRNALNMENLSQATKVAASQASASGVAIDELTAAVGTMVATTQQGGDVAGRAFKGILMNLQQVKASADEIGDGGEDITAESLSKYEAAAAALGVSLKEVRNGVVRLREPMEVLRELSIAVGKESEGSLKVANLVAAVGGKFRGNQLIALLNNWDTYEKMLSEFNSTQAVGSAFEEAEKSANNWAGSLNKVKNSWDELVNKFIDSDNAVDILQSLNKIIQNLSDDATVGSLKSIADALTSIVKIIGDLTDKFGTLPVIITGITTAFSIKSGKGKLTKYAYLRTVAICA